MGPKRWCRCIAVPANDILHVVFLPQNTSSTQFSSILSGAHLRSQRALRQIQNVRRHKDRIPIPTGGSTHGMTLAFGDWGIRIKDMTAKEVIKQKIKVIKGAGVSARFPRHSGLHQGACVASRTLARGRGRKRVSRG
ncbi:hypothetical protein ID866_11807 [Astraeus odoratus]|nr:hypothetical protein ID866_11807 [Astraeus odoratus]